MIVVPILVTLHEAQLDDLGAQTIHAMLPLLPFRVTRGDVYDKAIVLTGHCRGCRFSGYRNTHVFLIPRQPQTVIVDRFGAWATQLVPLAPEMGTRQ